MNYKDFPYLKAAEIKQFFQLNAGNIQKKWGQNFLIDPNIVNYIINCIPEDVILQIDSLTEIGCGLGVLTQHIVRFNKDVYLFEIDPILVSNLYKCYQEDNVEIIPGDVLENLSILGDKRVYIIGNLPYYITSPIITQTLKNLRYLKGAIFMVQKEFAQRLCKEISSISIFSNYFGTFEYKKEISQNCFYPSPSKKSAIIRYFPNEKKNVTTERIEILEIFLKSIFWGKRKSIHKSIKEAPFWKDSLVKAKYPNLQKKILDSLEYLKINSSYRPEELSKKDYYCLIDSIEL